MNQIAKHQNTSTIKVKIKTKMYSIANDNQHYSGGYSQCNEAKN